MDKERLKAAGIDADGALERLMGSEALMARLFRKFLEDGTFAALLESVNAGEKEEALKASHTLKGMCGNLSMDRLYRLFTAQVDLMRSEDWDGAAAMMPQISAAYEEAVSAIRDCFG
ncbi:MAG TPA: hypothetical protein H9763_12540 [Candidatus Eisenbergiella merdigallinarum]|uniref:HPt domain-containing protein n=1 Tax=Candidatus Eisenbergiella merdigallinarum TaxID=2838552 RepID=A0A9D2MV89_9FIRM|nr:hypothetical protein [Candidatus Eisenbergiella merdigallinarum]